MKHTFVLAQAESWGEVESTPASMAEFQQIVADSARLEIVDFNIHEHTRFEVRNRIAPYYVMSYMKEGSSIIRFRDREYVAHEGEVIIVPPHSVHDHYMGRGCRHSVFLWWHFNLTIGDHLDVLRFIKEPTIFTVQHRRDFERDFIEYVELHRQERHTLSTHLLRRAKALEVMAYLLEGAELINYINDSFADVPDDFVSMLYDIVHEPETWRHVTELATRYSYHPAYLSSRFRHFFGTTPSKLGRHLLYEKALVLIRSRDISLADVAFELGFSETSSFTRFFKSVEGLSPSALRKQSDPYATAEEIES